MIRCLEQNDAVRTKRVKDDQKNFLLFAVLAALVLFGWPYVANRFFPAANPPDNAVCGISWRPRGHAGRFAASFPLPRPVGLRNDQGLLSHDEFCPLAERMGSERHS